MLSTVGDLYRWWYALQTEEVLAERAKEQYFAPQVSEAPGEGNGSHYAYGWSIGKTRQGNRVIEHNGSNGIFFADFRIYPEDEVVLILATNASGLRYMSELGHLARIVIPEGEK